MPTDARKPPFLVVGIARSGTTLLRVMLDAHPNISIGPETNVLHHWFNAVDSSSLDRWSPDPHAYDAAVLGTFEQIHVTYMEERGKSRWGDKTPQYWRLIPRIVRSWPDVRFVYCLRDGRDVACSMRDRWGWRVHYTSRMWANGVNEAMNLADQFEENVHIVRYEELATDPRGTIKTVLDFIEEPWNENVLDPGEASHDDYESDSSVATGPLFTSSIGRWRNDLGPLDRRVAMHFMKPTLIRTGYDL